MIAVYFSYPFVRYAFIAGVLTALCASVLGVTLVLKRYSFIGDGLSHVAFGAMAIAAVLSVTNEMIIVMPLTVLCAVQLFQHLREYLRRCLQHPVRLYLNSDPDRG